MLVAILKAISIDPVLVQYLSLEFGLHATLVQLIRSDPTEYIVADAFAIAG